MIRRPALAAMLIGMLALSACSTVPSTSATMQITQVPTRAAEEVVTEPLSPEPGAPPDEIVRDFIDAAASARQGHPVAREYLAPDAAGSWDDETGISIIRRDFATIPTNAGSVRVTASLVGTVDQRGVFTVAGPGVFTQDFTVEQVEGEWRISDPPNGLIILEPDFIRLYDQLAAFFLDPTGQRLVPDPRHLIVGESQPTALVQRLLDGPAPSLAAGVRNPLSGVQLSRAVTVEGQAAVVELDGVSPDDTTVLSEISAQIVWTLDQLDSPRINTVEIRIDGEPVDIEGVPDRQTVEDWPNVDPDAVSVDAVGHYLTGGALHTVTQGEPAPGPAGEGAYGLTTAAVSSDPRSGELAFLAGVRTTAAGATLFAGPYGGQLASVLTGRSFSAPSVSATRMEAWVVRDGTTVIRVPSEGRPQLVSAPTLPGLGPADVLRLSPDGVRAALVIQGPSGRALYVGTVVRSENGGVSLPDLRQIAPDLSQVADVAWRDSSTLLVLAGDPGDDRTVPYEVGVDGWGLTDIPTSGLPSQPTAIGAAPTRQPLVSAAATGSTGSTIWQLVGGTWVIPVRGQEPLPGTAPFYPL